MKRNVLVMSVVVNVLLAVFLAYQYKLGAHKVSPSGNAKRIAIFTPVTHPSLEQIERGFCSVLKAEGAPRYDIKVFNAQGDRKLMRAQAEEIVQQNYDLVFTIATMPSVMINELMVKRGKKTPQVFGAVADPVGIGLVTSMQKPGGNVTGIVEGPEYEKQIEFLKMVKPDAATVLLVYNPTQGSGFVKDKERLESILAQHSIVLKTAEVVETNQIYAKIAPVISGCDVVMVLKDNTVVSGLDALVKLCNTHHKTLLATDLDSGDRGAALCFGVHEDQFGIHAAQYARDILESGKKPSDMACVPPGTDKFKINLHAVDAQGVVLSDNQKALFKVLETI